MNVTQAQTLQLMNVGSCLLFLFGGILSAQEPPATEGAANLQFETIRLDGGTSYRGLLQSKSDQQIEFVEIYRRPGMPMSATVRIISPGKVNEYIPSSAGDRKVLGEYVHRLRHRVAIEAENQQQVALVAAPGNSPHAWEYNGPWFQLTSTADEESTRRCIVRIEQIFRAYRQLIPPTVEGRRPLRIVLYGSVDEYQTVLRTIGVEIENLAFYAARERTIFAGAELATYARRLQHIRENHREALRKRDTEAASFREKLKEFSEKLAADGIEREQIKEEMARRNAAWNRETLYLERQISETDRRNDAAFAEVTEQMFRRLNHEAFHAYLAEYVIAGSRVSVSRWLNEGLAQIFETAQLDGDTLRIDAPNTLSLSHLQRDLASGQPMPLSELIASTEQEFLATHVTGGATRYYAYAWGLAYYLTIETQILKFDSPADLFVDSDTSKLERFELLVGIPLDEFEFEWRDAMEKLSTVRR